MIIPEHHFLGDTLSVFLSSRAVLFIDTLIDLPLVFPPAVAGVA
jgi:ABC-type sulfate transport system permease component